MTGNRVIVEFGDDGVLVGSGLPLERGRGRPCHMDWFLLGMFGGLVVFCFFSVFFARFFCFAFLVGVLFYFLAVFVLLIVFLLVFEFFFGPGVVAHAVVGDGAGIDNDALAVKGLKLHLAEVERGGLQGVEQESGDFRIELPGEDEAHDLHERDLDGVGVLEHGQGEAERGGGLRVQRNALALPVLVKETETGVPLLYPRIV